MGIQNSNFLPSPINRGEFFQEMGETQKLEKSRKENPKEENLEVTLYGKKGFTKKKKKKKSSNLPIGSANDRIATCVLHHSTCSFRNKSLVALN